MKTSTNNLWFRFICYVQVFLILVSTVGLVMDVHYCGGEIKSIGFYTQAPDCCSEVTPDDCPNKPITQIKKKSCCEDVAFYLHTDELADVKATLTNSNQFKTVFFHTTEVVKQYPIKYTTCQLEGKDPPVNVINRNILYSTFLI